MLFMIAMPALPMVFSKSAVSNENHPSQPTVLTAQSVVTSLVGKSRRALKVTVLDQQSADHRTCTFKQCGQRGLLDPHLRPGLDE